MAKKRNPFEKPKNMTAEDKAIREARGAAQQALGNIDLELEKLSSPHNGVPRACENGVLDDYQKGILERKAKLLLERKKYDPTTILRLQEFIK
jgi:hypothetical protein